MKLRAIRILLAAIFFAATAVCLLAGTHISAVTRLARGSQIILSTISVTAGATLVWLLLTILFGRIYCSTVCPVGFMTDFFSDVGMKIPAVRRRRPIGYRPGNRIARYILWVYLLSLVLGISAVPFMIEPWNMVCNMAALANPQAVSATWETLGMGVGAGAATGGAVGAVTLIGLALMGVIRGREFCTHYCPLGAALGLPGDRTVMHIEIDPDRCTSCGACEDVCRSNCIKVAERRVDNGRCVRCFDCITVCPEDAIRFQPNRNRPMLPLMRRARQ